jgi:sortase A
VIRNVRLSWDRIIRAVAACLCVIGASVLTYAGVKYAGGAYRADLARRQWDEQQARSTVAAARASAANSTAPALQAVAVGAPVARLLIPRIHLDEIVLEGVGDDELNAAPGHLPGSALPGMNGNAVISAHRDRHFSHLDELRIGDTVQTETGRGKGAWVIVSRRVIGRETPALFQTKDPTLTLTTCWPVRYFGTAPDRLILSARPIGTASASRLSKTT